MSAAKNQMRPEGGQRNNMQQMPKEGFSMCGEQESTIDSGG
jgi:hypothetical protein